MWKAIVVDGFAPEDDRLMVHDTYRNHFRSMLVYDFPQHYGEVRVLNVYYTIKRFILLNGGNGFESP